MVETAREELFSSRNGYWICHTSQHSWGAASLALGPCAHFSLLSTSLVTVSCFLASQLPRVQPCCSLPPAHGWAPSRTQPGGKGRGQLAQGLNVNAPFPVLCTYPAPRPRGTAWPLPSCCQSSPLRCCRPPQTGDGPVKQHKDREALPSPAPPPSAGLTEWQEKTGREGRRGMGLCRSVGVSCVYPTLSIPKYRIGDRS